MYKFAFLLKTYSGDFQYARRLINSFEKYNKDDIPLYIIVEKKDKNALMNLMPEIGENRNILIKAAEDICTYLIGHDVNGIKKGYINQEIIKLSFWENGWCRNYLCLDSDAYFIREFYYRDFMYDETVPYTCLIGDKELKTDPIYFESYWKDRDKAIKIIQKQIGFEHDNYLNCHGLQTISSEVMENFKNEFMDVKKYTYSDILEISPLEFSWYNLWLQKTNVIPLHICEPHFKTFHMKHQAVFTWWQGIKTADLARSYVGIVMQSNYGEDMLLYEDVQKIRIEIGRGKIFCMLKSIGYTLYKRLKKIIRENLYRLMK